jgi:hypothetical protein
MRDARAIGYSIWADPRLTLAPEDVNAGADQRHKLPCDNANLGSTFALTLDLIRLQKRSPWRMEFNTFLGLGLL